MSESSTSPSKRTTGRVEALFVGRGKAVRKEDCALIEVRPEGIVGDRHAGALKKADSRDKGIARGTMIRNWRQWSAVATEEMAVIAAGLNLALLDGALLGPNLIVSGIENFTKLPPGTLLRFPEAVLFVEAENDPCTHAGKAVKLDNSEVNPNHFVKAALGKRGLVGTVHTPGMIRVGDIVEVILPV